MTDVARSCKPLQVQAKCHLDKGVYLRGYNSKSQDVQHSIFQSSRNDSLNDFGGLMIVYFVFLFIHTEPREPGLLPEFAAA